MKLYVKANSNVGYLYIFKHGTGPGTVPRDVVFLKEKDLPNGYTAVWLDRFLKSSELRAYDIPSETEIKRYLDRIGYCQKDGDVVPCDEVEACDKVTASTHRYSAGRIEDDGTEDFYYDTGFDSYDEACDWGINHDCTHIYDRERDEFTPINSCDTKYFANMVSASNDPELDDDFLIEGYYDNQRRGLAESAETSDVSALNELANEYANKGYYIVVHNLTDGVITEFSADNWFNDIAPDGGASLFMSW